MSDVNEKMLAVTEDLKPILSVLKVEDAQAIIELKEELKDNWNKKQIFRTEWSKIKDELNDGTFDDQDVNTHQAVSLRLALQNRAMALGPNASDAERINAIGPLQTLERLGASGNLLNFKEAKLQLQSSNPQNNQQPQ